MKKLRAAVSTCGALLLLLVLLLVGHAQTISNLMVYKTSVERFDLGVDFTPVIGSDGTTLVQVISINTATNQSSTAQIIAASPAPSVSGNIVSFRVQGGTVGQVHKIYVQAQDTSTSAVYEGQITLTITSMP